MNEWVGFRTWVAAYGAAVALALSINLVPILSEP